MMVLILFPYCFISLRGRSRTATTRCDFTITPLYTFANEPSPRKSDSRYSYSPFFSVFIKNYYIHRGDGWMGMVVGMVVGMVSE